MPLLWALGWTVTTLVGIDVDQQFTIFGASGAVTFSALSGALLHLLLPVARPPATGTPHASTPDRSDLHEHQPATSSSAPAPSASPPSTPCGARRDGPDGQPQRLRPVPDDVEVVGGDAARSGLHHRGEPRAPPWSTRPSTRPTPGGLEEFPGAAGRGARRRRGRRSPAGQHGERLHVRPPGRPAAHRDPRVRGPHQKGRLRGRDGPRPARRPPGRTGRGGHRSRVGLLRSPRRRPVQPRRPRVPAALAGPTASVLGDPDQPHTYTYIPDIGEGLAVLGEHPDAPGQVWHLPNDPDTRTTRQLVDVVYRLAGQPRARVRAGAARCSSRLASLTNRTAARTAGDAVPVRGAVHRRQQQDHHQARRPAPPRSSRPWPRPLPATRTRRRRRTTTWGETRPMVGGPTGWARQRGPRF